MSAIKRTFHLNRARMGAFVGLVVMLWASLIGSTPVVRACEPVLEIVKTGPYTANPGDSIIFTLYIRTYDTGTVTHVVVWDDVGYDGIDKYEIFRRELTEAELATLNAGGTVVIEVPYQVPCDAGGYWLDNDAYAKGAFADGTTLAGTNDHEVWVLPPDQLDCTPAIDLEKLVNGQDADTPMEAVVVKVDDPLTFEYIVTNTGDAAFRHFVITDDNETPDDPTDDITIGTISNLAPGQSRTFTREAGAEPSLHTNVGTVCAITAAWQLGYQKFCDDDPANYSAPVGPGTGTPGYWMNHPEAWPGDVITIGGETYSKADAIQYMKMAVKKDKTFTMFPALVAAKLNVLIGNEDWCIPDTIAADEWMATYGPVGSGVKAGGKDSPWREGEPLYKALDKYNNGDLPCAISRDDLE